MQESILERIIMKFLPLTRLRKEMEEKIFELDARLSSEIKQTLNTAYTERIAEERLIELVLQRSGRRFEDLISTLAILERPGRDTANETQWMLSVAADISKARIERHVPIRIYLKVEEKPESIKRSEKPEKAKRRTTESPEYFAADEIFNHLLKILDEYFMLDMNLPTEHGSAWKRAWVKTRDKLTQNEAEEKITKALELTHLDKPQAEVSKLLAEATSAVIKELGPIDSACVQVGGILIVKTTVDGKSSVSVRTLTPLQLKKLEEQQTLLQSPGQVLDAIEAPK